MTLTLLFVAALLDPLLWIGCLLAGLANKRYGMALVVGLSWAGVCEVLLSLIQITYAVGAGTFARAVAALVITSLMFLVGRWKHGL